jgi:hypothetical protein
VPSVIERVTLSSPTRTEVGDERHPSARGSAWGGTRPGAADSSGVRDGLEGRSGIETGADVPELRREQLTVEVRDQGYEDGVLTEDDRDA